MLFTKIEKYSAIVGQPKQEFDLATEGQIEYNFLKNELQK